MNDFLFFVLSLEFKLRLQKLKNAVLTNVCMGLV